MRLRSSAVTITMLIRSLAMVIGINDDGGNTWCVARSAASEAALRAALDYACGPGGADCGPIGLNGLCYLPNTLQAHASYAFNSHYQRSSRSPGDCDFAGAATTAVTDPSYGSCTYPSSLSNAGGSISGTPNSSDANATPSSPMAPGFGGGGGGAASGSGQPPPYTDVSQASPLLPSFFLYVMCLLLFP